MAVLKSVNAIATTAVTTIYTVPSGGCVVKEIIVTNNSGNSIKPKLVFWKQSTGIGTTIINPDPCKYPYEGTFLELSTFLNAGDKINISCDQNGVAEVLISLVEV